MYIAANHTPGVMHITVLYILNIRLQVKCRTLYFIHCTSHNTLVYLQHLMMHRAALLCIKFKLCIAFTALNYFHITELQHIVYIELQCIVFI